MPEKGKLILVTGGARSGKSRLAEELADEISDGPVVYLATAGIEDEEMKQRVLRHQRRRPEHWETIEEAREAEKVIRQRGGCGGVILLDCLGLLLTNWLLGSDLSGGGAPAVWEDRARVEEIEQILLDRVRSLAAAAWEVESHVVLVTNEVGLGLVPEYPLGRVYRDLLGLSNQIVAAHADEVYVVWSGIPLKIKG